MWILIILGIIGVFYFMNYNKDKSELRNAVILKGGLDQVFADFLQCIHDDFDEYKIVKMSETEIEIFTRTVDGQNFVFVNNLGFGNKVNYRCDQRRSNFLNAEFALAGGIENQVECYEMIMAELRSKYKIQVR